MFNDIDSDSSNLRNRTGEGIFSIVFEFCEKFMRFLRNPKPYYGVMKGRFLNSFFMILLYKYILHPIAVYRIKHKCCINVVFLVMNPDMWRYDGVYRRMAKSKCFNPIIVTTGRLNVGKNTLLQELDATLKYFRGRKYNTVSGYDKSKGIWLDLRQLSPDILFYTQPYLDCIHSGFEYYHFPFSLVCYAPYAFYYSSVDWCWNNSIQNCAWRQFLANDYHHLMSRQVSKGMGYNVRVVGYGVEEELAAIAREDYQIDWAWRYDKRKRIIWAPHHSISQAETFRVSSFLEISDYMLELRNRFRDSVIFAFKPHPMLLSKLYALWGRERTDRYYAKWADSADSFYVPGDYKLLFAGSDAMIHCSGSFVIEYLYTGKPVQYVYSRARNPPEFGEIGELALSAHYQARTKGDLDEFIEKIVIAGIDSKKSDREHIANKYLKSPNGKMFSENVFNDILSGLGMNERNS